MTVNKANRNIRLDIDRLLASKDKNIRALGNAALDIDSPDRRHIGDGYLDAFEAKKLPTRLKPVYGKAKLEAEGARRADEMVMKLANYQNGDTKRDHYIEFNIGDRAVDASAALEAVRRGAKNVTVEVWRRDESDHSEWDWRSRHDAEKVETGTPLPDVKSFNHWLSSSGASYIRH